MSGAELEISVRTDRAKKIEVIAPVRSRRAVEIWRRREGARNRRDVGEKRGRSRKEGRGSPDEENRSLKQRRSIFQPVKLIR